MFSVHIVFLWPYGEINGIKISEAVTVTQRIRCYNLMALYKYAFYYYSIIIIIWNFSVRNDAQKLRHSTRWKNNGNVIVA